MHLIWRALLMMAIHHLVAGCPEGFFECGDKRCIFMGFACDGDPDCAGADDEAPELCDAAPAEIRLSGGPGNWSGRVEIRFLGTWGTVCDDTFDDLDAQVVCRSLGFHGPASSHGNGFFGAGEGVIWLDGLHCDGSETRLAHCDRAKWAHHNCQHWEDAAVTCSRPSPSQSVQHRRRPETEQCGQDGSRTDHVSYIFPTSKDTWTDMHARPLSKGRSAPARAGHSRSVRLVGSQKLNSSEAFPWIADLRLLVRGSSAHKCGAAIVSSYFALSAAHCLSDFVASDYILRVGEFDQERRSETEDDFEIDLIIIHPDFNKGVHLSNDIGLLKIKAKAGRGVRFSAFVKPVCLPSGSTPYLPGIIGTIGGWGHTENKTRSRHLRTAQVPLLSAGQCKHSTEYGADRIQPGMLCAGRVEGGSDACQADSGGPLVAHINGRWTLLGLISWGFGCGEAKKPGIYSDVQYHLRWILREMDKIPSPET